MVDKQTRAVAIANEKGGVGKTVTVINLAAALTLANQKVLVVDMDPQANATKGLGIIPEEAPASIYDLIANGNHKTLDDAIVATPWDGLDLIPSHVDLSGAEVELVEVDGRENRLHEALEPAFGRYDVILMDTPPSLSLLTVNVFTCASEVLVPCQTHPYAFGALGELFDTIDAVREEINPELSITGIVPTLVDRRTRVANTVMERLKSDERFRDLVFDTVIRNNATIAESAEVGKPVVFYRKSSYGAIDYNSLAEEFMERAGISG